MSKPIEIEVRIFLKNRKNIEEKLKKLWARIVYFSKIKDYWFCPKNVKNYKQASTDKTWYALRIRETIDNYTGKKSASLDCKTLVDGKNHSLCNEYEIDLSESYAARKILESIWQKEFLLIDKERMIYKYKTMKFCFDKIKWLWDWLEIEILTNKNIEKTYKQIINFAYELGITKEEIVDKSLTYLAMQNLSKF